MKSSVSEKSKENEELTLRMRNLVLEEGGDLFGVASARVLSAAPEGFRPHDILPEAHAVIVFGKRLSDATVETTPSRMFDTMYAITNAFIEHLTLILTDALVRSRYRAVAVGPHSSDARRFMGDISQKHAAVAAGLGRFGLQSLVLTPQFGPRQRWGTVITNAPLLLNHPLREELCKPEVCDAACLKGCPIRALSKHDMNGKEDHDFLPGGLWYYGKVDKLRCRTYRIKQKEELGWNTEGGHACAICLKVCPVGERT